MSQILFQKNIASHGRGLKSVCMQKGLVYLLRDRA